VKITKSQLKQIIKEELESVLIENQGYGKFKNAQEKRVFLAFQRIVLEEDGTYKSGVFDLFRNQSASLDVQKQQGGDYTQAIQQVHQYYVDIKKADPEVVRLIKNLMKRGKGIEFDGGKYYSPMRFVSYKEGVKGI
tara:strand:+ start:333 stop:740 length:408 start_codon:yes stop_codon:yes gene_type:complete